MIALSAVTPRTYQRSRSASFLGAGFAAGFGAFLLLCAIVARDCEGVVAFVVAAGLLLALLLFASLVILLSSEAIWPFKALTSLDTFSTFAVTALIRSCCL